MSLRLAGLRAMAFCLPSFSTLHDLTLPYLSSYSQGCVPWRFGYDALKILSYLERAKQQGENQADFFEDPSIRGTLTAVRSGTLASEFVRGWGFDLSAVSVLGSNRCPHCQHVATANVLLPACCYYQRAGLVLMVSGSILASSTARDSPLLLPSRFVHLILPALSRRLRGRRAPRRTRARAQGLFAALRARGGASVESTGGRALPVRRQEPSLRRCHWPPEGRLPRADR